MPSVVFHAQIYSDGTHVTWAESGPTSTGRYNTIILKDVIPGSHFSEAAMVRLRAFITTIDMPEDPKKEQKRWEKLFSRDVRFNKGRQPELDQICDLIRREHEIFRDKDMKGARLALKDAVMRAHKLLPHDEVEKIVNDALVEYVLKQ